ncbi:MAG: hypothetical protein LC777_20390 [Actinobacteria bacterium]|nr:hypothetical protein [Actinomycetota bacterium]
MLPRAAREQGSVQRYSLRGLGLAVLVLDRVLAEIPVTSITTFCLVPWVSVSR